MNISPKRYYIIGALGGLGFEICRNLLNSGHIVTGIDSFSPHCAFHSWFSERRKILSESDNFQLYNLDIRNIRHLALSDNELKSPVTLIFCEKLSYHVSSEIITDSRMSLLERLNNFCDLEAALIPVPAQSFIISPENILQCEFTIYEPSKNHNENLKYFPLPSLVGTNQSPYTFPLQQIWEMISHAKTSIPDSKNKVILRLEQAAELVINWSDNLESNDANHYKSSINIDKTFYCETISFIDKVAEKLNLDIDWKSSPDMCKESLKDFESLKRLDDAISIIDELLDAYKNTPAFPPYDWFSKKYWKRRYRS